MRSAPGFSWSDNNVLFKNAHQQHLLKKIYINMYICVCIYEYVLRSFEYLP